MDRVFLAVIIVLMATINCSSPNRRSFFDGRLKLTAVSGWKTMVSEGREQLENENNGAVISFTLFQGPDEDLGKFAYLRFESVDSSAWDEVINDLHPEINDTFEMKKYRGKDSLSTYVVCVFGKGTTFLSFTVVVDTEKYDEIKNEIEDIIESVQIE